ncbi:hypothetical protein like AT5G42905 [Hibiscus trionum]|uniref:RNase H type-1 domain-containing protein n=1 Tax=Hibiscus trionum TaxID=183268 RepID=A0A9W7J6M6_HIBTR|nr:hypothetical protein like AT5G42905 [Hibiscus trionum]
MFVRWSPPMIGWIKVNTHGTRKDAKSQASCGGVLCDHASYWLRGFLRFIGRCSVIEVELWGILSRLLVVWELGYTYVVIESEC